MFPVFEITAFKTVPQYSILIFRSTIDLLCQLKNRDKPFGEKPAAGHEPCEEDEGKEEWLGTGLTELVDAGFGTKGGHGHSEEESVKAVDGAHDAFGQKIK